MPTNTLGTHLPKYLSKAGTHQNIDFNRRNAKILLFFPDDSQKIHVCFLTEHGGIQRHWKIASRSMYTRYLSFIRYLPKYLVHYHSYLYKNSELVVSSKQFFRSTTFQTLIILYKKQVIIEKCLWVS